jgi:hypothetical protein
MRVLIEVEQRFREELADNPSAVLPRQDPTQRSPLFSPLNLLRTDAADLDLEAQASAQSGFSHSMTRLTYRFRT